MKYIFFGIMRNSREGKEKKGVGLGLKGTDTHVVKLKSCIVNPRSLVKLWMIRATTMVLLWSCLVQLITLGRFLGLLFSKNGLLTFPRSLLHHSLLNHFHERVSSFVSFLFITLMLLIFVS